jgi:DNA invertase Pin-like site-specific DNA recombinase
MSARTYKAQPTHDSLLEGTNTLPIDRPIAVYYRQSTDAQIGNVSTSLQTVDMVKHLQSRGWSDDQIIMIDMDGGISGTTKIDERPGMRKLFELITDAKIGAVACQDEDRLFRDITQIQVNIFIEACRQSQIIVLTPSMVYDFAHPQMGTFHARQFRFKSEMSAEFITSYLRGRLHPAKKRLMMEGKWAGGTVPLGYVIDMRKILPDGTANSYFRKYVPYEPFAQIVREWFDIFIKKSGNVHGTLKHILAYGPYYPDPTTQVPDSFRLVLSPTVKNCGKGYCLGKTGLIRTLTNAAYLGHWAVNNTIVIWNNHQAVIDENTFFQAFNYLSSVSLDGNPNPSFNAYYKNARPTLEEKRPVERPLFSGLIFSEIDGQVRRGITTYRSRFQHYGYHVETTGAIRNFVWHKRADHLDTALIKLLKEKLRVTFDVDTWNTSIEQFKLEIEKERHLKQRQRDVLRQTMDNLLLSLETLTHPEMIKRAEERFSEAEKEYQRLNSDVMSAAAEMAQFESITNLREVSTQALSGWDAMTQAEKLIVIQSFILKVMVTPQDGQELDICVHWRDGSSDAIRLGRSGTTYNTWLKSQEERLFALVDEGASQVEICAVFPYRKWGAIRHKVWSERGAASLQLSPLPIRDEETYTDYLKRTTSLDTSYKARSGERWNQKDLDTLKMMVKSGATQIEIAQAFPHRNWGRLRATITKVCGKDAKILGTASKNGLAGDIRKYETYEMYLIRTQRETRTPSASDNYSEDDEPSEATYKHLTSEFHSEKVFPCVLKSLHRALVSTHRQSFRQWKSCDEELEKDGSASAADRPSADRQRSKCA